MEEHRPALNANGNEFEIIEFYIDETTSDGEAYRGYYGMNVAKVLEIIRRPDVTEMPGSHHPSVLGTFNLRGKILPLIDLGIWLGKENGEKDSLKVIVSEFSGIVCAFLVSGVTHIHRLAWNQVEPPDQYLQAFSNHSLTGVVRINERILFILDMEQIVSSMTPGQTYADMEKDSELPQEYGRGCRVLVVDDSLSIRKLLASILAKAGFEVMSAGTGAEGLSLLQGFLDKNPGASIAEMVDLVVSDIEMPQMDGHTLLRKVKEDPRLNQLPVILFSSHITDALRQKGVELKADDQIAKPDLPMLTRRVRDLIRERWGK